MIAGSTPGNNRRNIRSVLGLANTFWDHLKLSVGWSDERERDILRNELQVIQEYRTDNTFDYDLTDRLKMALKANYRARDGGRDQDRFTLDLSLLQCAKKIDVPRHHSPHAICLSRETSPEPGTLQIHTPPDDSGAKAREGL